MAEINLLKTTTATPSDVGSAVTRVANRVMLGILILLVGLYALLFIVQWNNGRKIKIANTALQQVQTSVSNDKARQEVVARQGQVKAATDLIAKHSYWSKLLPELARVSLSSASYSAIKADETGKLTLTVKVSSYSDLDKFMQIFDLPAYNQQFSNVKLVSVSKIQQESTIVLSALLELTFDPAYIKAVTK